LLYHLLSVRKIRFLTDHFYLLSSFLLTNSINYGTGLIPSQITIFISSISWYRGSIITDAEGRPRVEVDMLPIIIVINQFSFLMEMCYMRQQEMLLIQWLVQNNLVLVYHTGSVCFDNVITVQSIMLLNINQAVQLLLRELNFIYMFYSQLALFMG